MDMCFYWIKDQVNQGHFQVHWSKCDINLADYFTKHHPPTHHIHMQPTYLHSLQLAQDTKSRGGVDPGLRPQRKHDQGSYATRLGGPSGSCTRYSRATARQMRWLDTSS